MNISSLWRTAGVFNRSRVLAAVAGLAMCQAALAGTWTKITANPPGAIQQMVLLSDGTVMCSNQNGSTIGSAWYKLTPSATGSYVAGTWSTLATAPHTRLYFQVQVLKDARVYVSGGEYGTGGPYAEIYNPQTNAWTQLTIPASLWTPGIQSNDFYDGNSEILPDGKVLVMPVFPHSSGIPLRYDPATNTWTNAGKLFRGTYQDEATWAKLPDNTILTIDPFGQFSERYNPATNTWINDSNVPVALYDPFGFELGGAAYLPNGKVLFLGSTGNTALYTPTGTTAPGTWVAGPVIPSSRGTPDAPCAMMVDGKVLCAVSAIPTSGNHFPSPTYFYEYNYVTNSFTLVNPPVGASDPISAYQAAMLCLPNGQVMYSHMGTSVYVYTPSGAPLAAGKPVITSITSNGDGSFHMVGTGLNGISEGASYGDDLQANTNYPIVRVTHNNGNTYYGRTYNWSSTSIATGATPVTTEYRLHTGQPAGAYSLVVTANGIASDAVSAPVVSTGPDPVLTCPLGTAQFTVAATGVGPISYQWRRGVTPLTNGGNISGALTSTLTINPADFVDAGTDYNCVVTNALGSTTSPDAALMVCVADFDCNGFPNGDDFDSFMTEFFFGTPAADVDHNDFTNGDDFDYFMEHFVLGC